jgi:hypothetical protein
VELRCDPLCHFAPPCFSSVPWSWSSISSTRSSGLIKQVTSPAASEAHSTQQATNCAEFKACFKQQPTTFAASSARFEQQRTSNRIKDECFSQCLHLRQLTEVHWEIDYRKIIGIYRNFDGKLLHSYFTTVSEVFLELIAPLRPFQRCFGS